MPKVKVREEFEDWWDSQSSKFDTITLLNKEQMLLAFEAGHEIAWDRCLEENY